MDHHDTLTIGMLHCQTSTSHKVDSPLTTILEAVSQHPEVDILLAPEWFFVSEGDDFYTPHEFAFISRRLEESTQGLEMLLVPGSIARLDDDGNYRNTTLAVSDGKTLLEYSKRKDGGDTYFASKVNDKKGGNAAGSRTSFQRVRTPLKKKDQVRWKKGETKQQPGATMRSAWRYVQIIVPGSSGARTDNPTWTSRSSCPVACTCTRAISQSITRG